jgi:hypothetical protein
MILYWHFKLAFPFISGFYAYSFSLYFVKAFKHKDFIVISFKFGPQQEDLLKGMLFALAHFHTFRPTVVAHPTCVFFSLVDDTHIVGPTLDMVLVLL